MKESIKIRDGFGHIVEVDAVRVKIPGIDWKDIEFYIHKEIDAINSQHWGKWVITEKTTGAAVSHGKTKEAAIRAAFTRLMFCGEMIFRVKIAEIIEKRGGLK